MTVRGNQKASASKIHLRGVSSKMTKIVISEAEEKFTEHRKVKADVFGKKFQIIVKYEAFRVYRTHPLSRALFDDAFYFLPI